MRAIEPQDPARTFAAVLDALPVVAFLARPDGSISYVSRAWAEYTGLEPAHALETRFPAMIHPDQRDRAVAHWLAANVAQTPYRDELRLRFADGTYRWALCQAQPMRDASHDGIIGWFGTVTDIDDRKRTEETYREQAEFNARLIDSSDDCIKIVDLQARIVSMSANGQKSLGITDMDAVVGSSWLDFWHDDGDRAAANAAIEAARAGASGKFIGYFPVAGMPRWFDVAVTAILDADGRPEKLLIVSRDITVGRLTDKARERFVALVENSGDFIGMGDVDGMMYVNEAGRQLLEIDSLEIAKATPLLEYFCPADRDFVRTDVLPALRETGRWLGDFQFRNFRTGAPVPVAYHVFRLVDQSGGEMGIATVSRDRRRRVRIEAGLRLLSRTGVAELHSLNSIVTLPTIAQAFVPEYASYSIVDIISAGAGWQRTVVHHDPSKEQIISDLSQPSDSHPVAQAMREGRSSLVIINDASDTSFGGQTDRVQAIAALGVRSFITVPVIMPNGEIAGGLTAARDRTHPAGDYMADDVAFVEEAGRRAGAAIANVRLYERERRIAVELQAASLPASLPRSEYLRLDAEYRPGSDEATIGGDWYDAFVLRDGRVAISVGDVIGHGLHAAVTMTKLRQAMQAAAMVSPDPNVMLRVADETLRLIDVDGYATAIAALYDPQAQTLTFASAGHPGPIVRTPDGRISDHSASGLLLGLRTGAETDVLVVAVPPQSTIVLYTDGLVEATRDFEASSARLHAAIARNDVITQPAPARAIVDFVLGTTTAFDDIAVLVARTI